jgi:hypothetical protein
MDPALRRRLDAGLALLAIVAFATLSMAFSAATAVAVALVTGAVAAVAWDTTHRLTPDEN